MMIAHDITSERLAEIKARAEAFGTANYERERGSRERLNPASRGSFEGG